MEGVVNCDKEAFEMTRDYPAWSPLDNENGYLSVFLISRRSSRACDRGETRPSSNAHAARVFVCHAVEGKTRVPPSVGQLRSILYISVTVSVFFISFSRRLLLEPAFFSRS